MHIAIDTNCILPGQVGGIENYTLSLIEALKNPASPAKQLLLLTRPENHLLFLPFADESTAVHQLIRPSHAGRPVSNWAVVLQRDPAGGRAALANFQRQKADLLLEKCVDLVHFPGNTVNPLELSLPVVLNLHDLQHRHYPAYFSQAELDNREKWWRASANRADALIAASHYVRDDLQTQWQIDAAKIFVTPDPFQAGFFSLPSPEELGLLKKRMSLPDCFFFYPAAAWPHKNHERLCRAFLAANIPGAQLILTGGGYAESPLPALIHSLGATDTIRHLGHVSQADLVGLYHLATAMIFPSQYESWSIPIMEAMACGCPVASSNVTSLPEEVRDAGILFPPNNIRAMAAAMSTLTGDATLRSKLSRLGKERVGQFDQKQFVAQLSVAYKSARDRYFARKAA